METIELDCATVVPLSVLSALLVYEDAETGLRGQRALAGIQGGGQFEAAVQVKLWRSDLLNAIWLREQAAVDAARSDILMLSFHECRALPNAVGKWLSAWLELKSGRPCALCVLLDDCAPRGLPAAALSAYVQTIANAAGADLFWGFCGDMQVESGVLENKAWPGIPSDSPVQTRAAAHPAGPYSRWGINE